MRMGSAHYVERMAVRRTVIIVVTIILAIGVAGLVQRTFGWLSSFVVLVVVSALGGLLGRYLTNRELDRDASA